MARLFGKEYHEHSNSWFFKSSVTRLQLRELNFKKFLDENRNVIFQFEAVPERQNVFPAKLDIIYDKAKQVIREHTCSECGSDTCKHYLSLLNYTYHYLSTDLLDEVVVQTYQSKLLDYNEFWQRVVLNAKIEIGDIYDKTTDKIRFYLKSYMPMNIRLIAILTAGLDSKKEDQEFIQGAERQMMALTENELHLLELLQVSKCSFSRKGCFYSIYKHRFIKFFPILRSLRNKVFIKETGDHLQFMEDEFRVNFQVVKSNSKNFLLKTSSAEQISAVYVGKTTYVFNKNEVRSINLPFTKEISEQVFEEGYVLAKTDLVYLSSVVARQLSLIKCYLDFEEGITLPEVYHNTPVICFDLQKEDKKIIMKGLLEYAEDVFIPMSVVRFPVELVRYDQQDVVTWFYIPPTIKYKIFEFVKKFPESQNNRLEENSQLVFEGDEHIDELKKVIFEHADPTWNIQLSDELKNEFVYKVSLQPLIKTRETGHINWFEYDVEYNYKDISFTHAELKQFFQTKEKFLKLEDGRLLYFENTEAFEAMEDILKKSEKTQDEGYRLSVYNLPYLYQLNTINQGIKVIGNSYLDEMYDAIISRKLTEKNPLPHLLSHVMRSYQKAGFQWLVMLEKYGLAGILADDMGLGKTVQAISALSRLPANSRSIVICPKTLLFNWAAEIEKFNKSLSYVLYEGSQKYRMELLENLNVNILFASYSIIQNDIEELSKIEFDYIILDEAQHIKNSTAMRTKAVKKLKAKHHLALSGTPIENNPTELWSIFDFLMPGYLPALKYFKNEYMSEKQKEANEKLKMLVSPFILRRRKKDVLIELPDKQEQIAYCKMTKIQEKMYLQVLDNVKQNFLQQDKEVKSSYLHILAALTKLRQICDHPALIDKDVKRDEELSGKLELLKEIIVDAIESGKKLLIFSQFVQMLQVMKEMLQRENVSFEYMDGSTKNRQKVIDNFNNNNNIRAFLISLKTGGYGLNLTAADTVIIVDPWWNPMGENQAIDRAHRIGQTKKVMVYKIITKGTIEEKIITLQQTKKEMFDYIIEGGQSVINKMSSEDLRNLLEY
jgi:SNF2 family DNA or RNA helicase